MKISYNWLKEYIDIDLSVDELAQKITDSGIEVEEIIPALPKYENIVLGKVNSVKKHPDADKLSICEVSTGNEEFQVICGAANVAVGQKIPFAQIGAVLPNGIKIQKAKIRGVASSGMICSKQELALEQHSDGIWPIETDFAPGTDINIVLQKYNDYLFDLFVTSNRPDCLSHIGIAREIAVFTDRRVKLPKTNLPESNSLKTSEQVKITINYPEGCPRYAARVINNVKIGPSPLWIKEKLESVGLRSINNVVDVTNFVLQEMGQPLHAFDFDTIKDQHIIVNKSSHGEKFTTLDDKERNLPENTVMICDAERSVAIGGIMGGQNSEVKNSTKNILLESAYFNPANIAESSRQLLLTTDASQRFEKGTDYENVIFALDRATELIHQLAGGEISKGVVDCYPNKIQQKSVKFNPEQVNRILGSNLDEKTIFDVLEKIHLKNTENGISVPSYRVDINQEIDLIEEVARLINFDNLPTSIMEPLYLDQIPKTSDDLISKIRETLIEIGLQEVFTNSMISEKQASIIHNDNLVKILNPISDELSVMRPSLIPGILNAINHNQNRNNPDLKIFEIGRNFLAARNNELPHQPMSCAIALTGKRQPENWSGDVVPFDFFDLKGLIEDLFAKLNLAIPVFEKEADTNFFEKDFTIQIKSESENLGICGKINKSIQNRFDIENDVLVAIFDFEKLINLISTDKKYRTLGKYPYIEKDMALILENKIPAGSVINFISGQGGKLLRKTDIFDVYSGEKVGDGFKSLAFRLRFQSDERTLTDAEVDQIFKKIIRKCEGNFNARLRDK